MLIDPQEQARRWLKSTEKSEGLITIKSSKSSTKENKDTVRLLEIGITQGKPMIIEDVSETLDSSISSILSKKTYKKDDGRTVIKLGDHELSYDKNFRLYLLCKASNPNYLPDVFGTLNVINFTVTVPGLEDQLLVEVVRLENPKLEKERDGIVVSLAGDQKLLEETQNSILDMIADSQGYILDNLALVSALQRSKSTSKDITKRVEATVVIETRINASRDSFKDIAIRGTVLYFVISQIPGINPMYQYSLSFITKIFCSAIQNTVGTEDRVAKIIENVTRVIYLVVCRGLFQSDKKLLGFLFATAIARNNNTINTHAWNTFIRGGGVINKKNPKKNPLIGKISEVQWDLVCKIESKINNFNGIADDMINYSKTWSEYITGDIVYSVIPNRYNLIDTFSKILLIKVLRPEKLIYFIDIYTQEILGKEFLNASTSDIEPLFEENDKKTPILFILSQGTDPIESITKICKEKSMIERLQMISLGQGQGTKAQDSFDKSKSQGYWLLLQNCHLAKSWLPALESLIETLQDDTNVHKDFRLILTSMPSDYFPIPILQNSLKVTTEPPSGIKSNMLKVFLQAHSAFSADSARPEVLKKIIFSISFFHSLVMERRKFGALGFNIRYDFNESDFITSVKLMKLLVEENEEIPWEGIQYIIGNINYGGRVTDVNDRLCLMAIFNKCCNSDMLDEPFFFTENEVYRIPTDLDYVQYIKNLPDFDLPEVFGLNNNAQITLESQLTDNLVSCLLKTQPKEITSEALDLDKVVHGLSKSLSISLPEVVDLRIAHPDLTVTDSKGSIPSLSTFLFQELEKFNRLLETMKKTLKDLRNAIKGKVIMTDNLTDMYSSLLNSIIPKLWQEVSYPSIQSLGPWISDLTSRIKFMFDWLKYGSQNCYWLSGFFFPQSFLTAVLQTYSRKFNDPIDELTFSYNVTNFTLQNFVKTKSNGVFVYGLYLEGARWDFSEMALADAFDREIYFNMPLIEFLPVKDNVSREGDYMCPVYKTPKRSGILSSTGLSTNFIVYVDLASDENPDKWTLLGTALLCQIND
jgi:dynein heavy chain, axonemal